MTRSEAKTLFERMHPGFFDQPYVKAMPDGMLYEEMILWLSAFSADVPAAAQDGIVYGFFSGDMDALKESVRAVDAGWVQYFNHPEEIFCAFDGERVVSFCLLDDMGEQEIGGRKIKIAGPGCVGTIPEYRKRGIGLRMVQLGTQILKERGYDVSYIHYTGVGPWYAKLGYETILKWGRSGIIE